MPHIRNTATRDLEVAGRVYPAGEVLEVGPGEAEYLSSNPNFVTVDDPAAGQGDKPERPSRRRSKED